MIRAVIGFFALGAVLCYIGYQEHTVSAGTSAEPVPVSLIKLEHGFAPPNNHIEIGEHVAVYEGMVYSYRQGRYETGEPTDKTKVQEVYYPIISKAHPFMRQLEELQNADPSQYEELVENLSLDDFAVIVRTSRYKNIGALPDSFAREEKVSGLVINQISSLGFQEQRLLAESFPNLDFSKLIILSDGRKPSDSTTSFGMMFAGGTIMLFAAAVGFFSMKS